VLWQRMRWMDAPVLRRDTSPVSALDLTDIDLAILAMACRSAAHYANGRPLQDRQRRPGLVASPQAFIALAERLEAARAAAARERMRDVLPLSAEDRARLGWGDGKGKGG